MDYLGVPIQAALEQLILAKYPWPLYDGIQFNSAEAVDFQINTYYIRVLDGKSFPAIADELGITVAAAQRRVFKVRQYLVWAIASGDMTVALQRVMEEDGFRKDTAMRLLAIKLSRKEFEKAGQVQD